MPITSIQETSLNQTQTESMRFALEALEGLINRTSAQAIYSFMETERRIAISACVGLRKALAEQPAQPQQQKSGIANSPNAPEICDDPFAEIYGEVKKGTEVYTIPSPQRQQLPDGIPSPDELEALSDGNDGMLLNEDFPCKLDRLARWLREYAASPQPAPATELREQEPVAWIDPKHLDWLAQSPDNLTGAGLAARQRSADMVSLYTSPPTLLLAQRQSRSDVKPLTNEMAVAAALNTSPTAQSKPQPLTGLMSIARTHPHGQVVTVSFETVDEAIAFEQYAIKAAHRIKKQP